MLSIAVDPTANGTVFAGSNHGVHVSTNAGSSWASATGDLPDVMIADLVVHPIAGRLFAGTHGRGIYSTDLTALRGEGGQGSAFPLRGQAQPSWARMTIEERDQALFVSCPGAGHGTLVLYDPAGREVYRHEVRVSDAGASIETPTVFSRGVYIARLRSADGGDFRGKLVLR